MFQVEVFCNSADIEDYDPDEGLSEIFEHYIQVRLLKLSASLTPQFFKRAFCIFKKTWIYPGKRNK